MKRSNSRYLLSLPERTLRAVTALAAGLIRESSEITLPPAFRRSRVYQAMVEQTLRFLIEKVGKVAGAYGSGGELPENFLVRRGAGNGIEFVSLAVFHASPVWVLAALADATGAGNRVLGEIARTLEAEGYLTGAAGVRSVTDLLDGLERGSGQLADTINTPPLNREAMLKEWETLKAAVASREQVEADWEKLKATAAEQRKPLMQVSTVVALNTLRCGKQMLADPLLDHYSQTLEEMRRMGFWDFAAREMSPYWRAAVANFKS